MVTISTRYHNPADHVIRVLIALARDVALMSKGVRFHSWKCRDTEFQMEYSS